MSVDLLERKIDAQLDSILGKRKWNQQQENLWLNVQQPESNHDDQIHDLLLANYKKRRTMPRPKGGKSKPPAHTMKLLEPEQKQNVKQPTTSQPLIKSDLKKKDGDSHSHTSISRQIINSASKKVKPDYDKKKEEPITDKMESIQSDDQPEEEQVVYANEDDAMHALLTERYMKRRRQNNSTDVSSRSFSSSVSKNVSVPSQLPLFPIKKIKRHKEIKYKSGIIIPYEGKKYTTSNVRNIQTGEERIDRAVFSDQEKKQASIDLVEHWADYQRNEPIERKRRDQLELWHMVKDSVGQIFVTEPMETWIDEHQEWYEGTKDEEEYNAALKQYKALRDYVFDLIITFSGLKPPINRTETLEQTLTQILRTRMQITNTKPKVDMISDRTSIIEIIKEYDDTKWKTWKETLPPQTVCKPLKYEILNAHPLDKFIAFRDDYHEYFVFGIGDPVHDFDKQTISMTGLVHHCFNPFNPIEAIMLHKRTDAWKNGTSKYTGKTDYEIRKGWKANGKEKAAAGSKFHLKLEMYLNDESWQDGETDEEFQYFLTYMHEFVLAKGWKVFRTEWKVFYFDLKLAGCVDIVYILPDGRLAVFDYKHWWDFEVLPHPKYPKFGKPPAEHIADNKTGHAYLQINGYVNPIEIIYGYEVAYMAVLPFHKNHGSYVVIEVPNLRHIVKQIFEKRRKELFEKKRQAKLDEYLDVYPEWYYME